MPESRVPMPDARVPRPGDAFHQSPHYGGNCGDCKILDIGVAVANSRAVHTHQFTFDLFHPSVDPLVCIFGFAIFIDDQTEKMVFIKHAT